MNRIDDMSVAGNNWYTGVDSRFGLRLATVRANESNIALPGCLQGSTPGPWQTVTGRGLTPATTRALPSRNYAGTPGASVTRRDSDRLLGV